VKFTTFQAVIPLKETKADNATLKAELEKSRKQLQPEMRKCEFYQQQVMGGEREDLIGDVAVLAQPSLEQARPAYRRDRRAMSVMVRRRPKSEAESCRKKPWTMGGTHLGVLTCRKSP
jgi:hypothetical protein